MVHKTHPLFTSRQVKLINERCRKLRVKSDLIEDCFQQLSMKVLLSNRPKIVLAPSSIDNHIKSLLCKEIRHRERLRSLRDGFQEEIVYPLTLQIDIRYMIKSMPRLKRQVCCLMAAGFSRKQISQKLNMSPRTIGRHVVEIKRRLVEYS